MSLRYRYYWTAFIFALVAAISAGMAYAGNLRGLPRAIATIIFVLSAVIAVVFRFLAVSMPRE